LVYLGEAYESAIVKAEIPYPDVNNPQLELKTDTAFLQTIVSGAKSLYFYLPAKGRDHFYIKTE